MTKEPWKEVRENWPFDGQCPECGRIRDHDIECSLCPHEYRVWKIRAMQSNLDMLVMKSHKLARRAIMWEGKFRIVKHENNKLRRKLYRQGHPE